MPNNFQDLDKRLRELWWRRGELDQSEWEELFQVVQQKLGGQKFSQYSSLPGVLPEDLITDFFQDKVLIPAKNSTYQASDLKHSGVLALYYSRYLLDRIDAVPFTSAEEKSGSDQNDYIERLSEGNFDVLYAGLREAEPDISDVLNDLGLTLEHVCQEAAVFLKTQGAWQHLQKDGYWIRLYLSKHHCTDKEDTVPLDTLARQYDIPSYHYKAKKLGITWTRGGFESPEDFAKTLLGQWIISLGITIQRDDPAALHAALKILCHAALSSSGTP